MELCALSPSEAGEEVRLVLARDEDAIKGAYLATSLGGVESTVSYPILSSHVGLSREELKLLDVSESTVRLSVGIEGATDLIADLEQALKRA